MLNQTQKPMIRKTMILACLLVLGWIAHLSPVQAQAVAPLTLAEAQKISEAAEARARQDNWNVVIAVLDAGGHLIALRRMDGTQIGSVDVAQKKAETAVKFKRSTKVFEESVKSGNLHILALGVTPVEGGLPILRDGQVIGSIGISGVTSVQDGIIAAAGIEAL